MARPNQPLFPRRFVLGAALLFALLVATVVFVSARKPAPVPPLPFSTNSFIATVPPMAGLFALPKNPTLGERFRHFLFGLSTKFSKSSSGTWSFGPSPVRGCSIQGLLNQCNDVTGTRYLMPLGVAAGVVQFGNTNVLDGPHWVAAFETALQSDGVQCWDEQTHRTGPEHLVLLRFPAQKVVVVLPVRAAAEFQRTNAIHLTGTN